MTMITPSYLGETIEYSSLHACRSTLEDPTDGDVDEDSQVFKDWDEAEPDRGDKTERDAWLAEKPTAETVHAAWAEALEAHLEEQRSTADDALGALSI